LVVCLDPDPYGGDEDLKLEYTLSWVGNEFSSGRMPETCVHLCVQRGVLQVIYDSFFWLKKPILSLFARFYIKSCRKLLYLLYMFLYKTIKLYIKE